jgi:hypothetical protein
MTPKFIEIRLGENSAPSRFEIVEVEKDNFMLKTKDLYVGLLGALQNWLQSNIFMGETGYAEMLWESSSSLIKEAYKADHFFIGGEKKLMEWSVSQGELIKDYGDIMTG